MGRRDSDAGRRVTEDVIVRAHAGFGSVEDVIAQRRAVCRLAVELLTDGGTHADPDVSDNPMVRAHLGSVLSGDNGYRPAGAGGRARHDVADRPPALLTESSPEFSAARHRLLAGIAASAPRPHGSTRGWWRCPRPGPCRRLPRR